MDPLLQRFEIAHQKNFQDALSEIKRGKKTSHWMWYIFPQLKGLGVSEMAQYYALENLSEAKVFLDDPYLGVNILSITSELLKLDTDNATIVFGRPDDRKLHSSMTLFSLVPGSADVFKKVLEKYFKGKPDERTLTLLSDQ